VTLSGTNTHTGNTTVTTGSLLKIGSSGAFGGSTFVVGGNGSFDNATGSALVLTTNMNLSGGSPVFVGTDDLTLGNVAISAANRTITVNAKTLTIGNVTEDVAGRNFTKAGAGVLVLNGNGTYTGTTTVSGGVLKIASGKSISSNVTVSAAGTLAGNGTVNGTVDVAGKIAPGASIGALSTGNLSLNSGTGGTLDSEVDMSNTPGADLVDVTGTVDVTNGTLNLTFSNAPAAASLEGSPQTYTLVRNDSNDAVTSAFSTINIAGLGAEYLVSLDYTYSGTDQVGRLGDGNDIAVTVAPEPSSGLVVLGGVLGMLNGRRRRSAKKVLAN
jgi:autotransporter-associated beta strand protein